MASVPVSTRFGNTGVAIQGRGVAGSCCAHLLGNAGFPLRVQEGARPRIPAILLSENTQALLCDLYGKREVFEGLFQIDRRIVAWGRDSPTVELPHRAAVISEEALLERLFPGPCETRESMTEADWTVYASSPLPLASEEHRFGTRRATATPVELKSSQASACWIEALECGWLFLTPDSANTGWLIAVGDSVENLLAQSRLVQKEVKGHGVAGPAFPCLPARIVDPFCGPGWLACGTAALGFDPLCGDGTGNAVREALLAAAVIRAGATGGDLDGLLAHYRARLVAGFSRHLELCRGFYLTGNIGPWWQREIVALEAGLTWSRRVFVYAQVGFRFDRLERWSGS